MSVHELVLTVDIQHRGAPFDGWGTSLCWFANATGTYPETLRERLYQAVFGPDGLNLNIARYNIGGGTGLDIADYLRPGGAVPGWWAHTYAGQDATFANREGYRQTWSPYDPAAYDFEADQGQRWWLQRLAQDQHITHFEAWANSPPFFMTNSGYVTGGLDATKDQLRDDCIEAFTAYLVRVAEHLEQAHGMRFHSINPMNEPNTDFWFTPLNSDGSPIGSSEGAHVSPELQNKLIQALYTELRRPGTTTRAVISAPDETQPDLFVKDWQGWSDTTRQMVGQLNVHTYVTADRPKVREIATQAGKPLWMSEVEGSFAPGAFNPIDMRNGLGMAQHMVDDLRELEPKAWIFWQTIQDLPGPDWPGDVNWGSIFVPFTATPDESLPIVTNTKFNTVRNFTHYIHPGDIQVGVNDPSSVAFITPSGTGLRVVHVNSSDDSHDLGLDLTHIGDWRTATATTVTTTTPPPDDPTGNALVKTSAAINPDGSITVPSPAQSVVTLVIDNLHIRA